MNFALNETQGMIRRTVREYAAEHIAPYSAEWDRTETFPAEAVSGLGRLGITGLVFPQRYGGGDGDMVSFVVALEELAKVDAAVAVTVAVVSSLCGSLLIEYGSDKQKDRWLKPLADGEAIAAFGLTEPEAGSDVAGIATRADLDGDEWVITGAKSFITNAGTPLTSFVIVAAVTGKKADGSNELSNIIVPTGAPGFSVGEPYKKLGWRASDTRPIHLERCRVPKDHLLGTEGRGLNQFLFALDGARVGLSAMAVGLAETSLQLALDYARQRRAFGNPISKFQEIQGKLADMAVGVDLSRLATFRAADLMDRGKPYKKEAAIAKLFASETALKVVNDAVQVFGGSGFMEETPITRLYRDARVLTIGEGTSEIQRMVIARELGC